MTHHPETDRSNAGRTRGRRRAARAAAWLAAQVLVGVLLAACGGHGNTAGGSPPGPTAATAPTGQHTTNATPAIPGGVYGHPLFSPDVDVTTAGIYVAWQLAPLASGGQTELARVDEASGQILAARSLGPVNFDQALSAGGSLWVATSSRTGETLLRLDPRTLAVIHRRWIGAGGAQGWSGRVLAVAAGGLWVAGGNRLLRLALPAGTLTGSVTLPRAASSDVSANAAGTVLVTGEANRSGRGTVQRRDPVSGAVLASYPMLGVAAPMVAGPVGAAIWVSEATGMMGYVQRLDAGTLAAPAGGCPDPAGSVTSACAMGTHGITARLVNGLLWVTQTAGGSRLNYCAEPSDNRRLASIKLPQPAQDEVLAIAPDRIFYAAPGNGARQYLRTIPVPPRCESG